MSCELILVSFLVLSLGLVPVLAVYIPGYDYSQSPPRSTDIYCTNRSSLLSVSQQQQNRKLDLPLGWLDDKSLAWALLKDNPGDRRAASYQQARTNERPSDDAALGELERRLPKDCGLAPKSSFEPYVSGGFDAKPGDYPSYVRIIKYYSKSEATCGGTLISDRHVITAAHCVEEDKYTSLEVVVSMRQDDPEAKRYQIKRADYCASPLYDFKLEHDQNANERTNHDVALLTIVDGSVSFNDFVQPACLPREPITEKKSLRAVGLGMVDNEDQFNVKYAETLQVLPVKLEECDELDIHPMKTCFVPSDPDHVGDTCGGDSGGPIYGYESGKMTVVAGTAYGPDLCRAGVAGKSVNTDFYAIRAEIGRLLLECGGNIDPPPEEAPEVPVEEAQKEPEESPEEPAKELENPQETPEEPAGEENEVLVTYSS